MDAGTVRVRRIAPDDGPLLRELRLRSLSDAPEAFGQTADEARARTDDDWTAQARAASSGERRAWLIAEIDDVPVGLVLARRRPPDTALVFSMWVDAGHRRAGIGRALLDAVSDWARGWGATTIVLWVFGANDVAICFYKRLGFAVIAAGPDAESGSPYGALAMSLALDPGESGMIAG
ncbi:MAG: GNAT family N-acetyltransferase [Chloroflexi bacterium]|nr:GNAT family N-acetyltransferase [Chloroflexota bacterium]